MYSRKQNKKYTYARLKEAYSDVIQKNFKIRTAAKLHGVPESTLRLRLASSNDSDIRRGGPTIFPTNQEQQLAEHCISMAHLGYGFARWQILDMAKNMCEITGKNMEPTKHWFYGFLSRFPDISMTKPKKRERERDEAVTDEVLTSYFQELKIVLEKYNIMNKAEQIWNVDETGISLDHNPTKILAKAGSNPHSVTSGRSPTTTVIAAGSALGETIPPYIIYKGERLSKELTLNGLQGTQYRTSPTGWSNSALFLDLFQNHFLHHITTKPCLLFYDGHSTHVTIDVIETARNNDVHLFVLPPHTSHCLQPLDVSVFSSFKQSLNTEFHKYLHAHPNSIILREELPRMIASAYRSSLTVANIMSGFRKTGIFPFCPSAPSVTPPTIDKKIETRPTSRKERKDNRTVKILFQEKATEFKEMKENNQPKKRRKTFVPPYGAAITEEFYFQEKKQQYEEKQANQARKRKLFSPPFANKGKENVKSKENNEDPKTQEKEQQRKGKGPHPNSRKRKGPCKKRPLLKRM